jgi:hypothetical protein
MKTASPALQGLLAGNQFAIADLYTITLRDGTILRYTSCDIDLVYSGNTYLANGLKIRRGPITTSVGVEVDAVELTIECDGTDTLLGQPIPAFVRNGGLDGARMLIQRAFMGDQTGPQVTIIVADTYVMRGETSLVTFVWSEAVSGFTLADVTADNGTLSGLTTSDNITFTATLTPTSTEVFDATNVVTVDQEGVQDQSGNWGVGSATSNNYTVDTSYWVQRGATLTASDAAIEDRYGISNSLSADGSVLAVGAWAWEGATGVDRGGVYIYDWTGSAWSQRGSVLQASDAANEDYFGISVCLSSDGSVLAVGAQSWEGVTGVDRGGVYIYDWTGSAWSQRGSVLHASDASNVDAFGSDVCLSGDGTILAVGAYGWEGATGVDCGGVYIYDWTGSAWSQRGSVLQASDAANNDEYGRGVALSADGSILAVGARQWEGATGVNRGGVYIYDWTGSAWSQRGSVLQASDAADNDFFGCRVRLSADGSILAVGARQWEGATGVDRGGVYIYDWTGSAWSQRGNVLAASDSANNNDFGSSVSLSADGSILAVGARAWEGASTDQGGVYIYDSTL